MWGSEEGPLAAGPLEPPAVADVAVLPPPVDGWRLDGRPLPLVGSALGATNPLASASVPSIGRKLNSSGLSWLALKPDSAAAADDDGAASLVSGDGAGGGGDDRCSRGDWDAGGRWVGVTAWSSGWLAPFDV